MSKIEKPAFGGNRVGAFSSGDERLQARENLAHDGVWGVSDETGLSRAPVEGANLVRENHSSKQGEATCTIVRAR